MIKILDVLRFASTVLRERRVRAILTIIGIAIGPAAMVAIIGTVQGYSQVIISELSSLGENTIVIFPNNNYVISRNDILFLESINGVDDVLPFYSLNGYYRRMDGEEMDVSIYAINIDKLFRLISNLELRDGSIPPERSQSTAVIGYTLAFDEEGRQLVRVGGVISVKTAEVRGNQIVLRSINLRVGGITAKYGNALVMNPDETIYIPLEAGKTLLGLKRYSGVLISVSESGKVEYVVSRIRDHYKEIVNIVSFERIAQSVGSIINTLNFLLLTLSLSAFIVAITGIMATMFTSVVERTREIGVLKALGYTNRDVLILILTESIIMSIIGGVIGVSIGSMGAYILASRSFRLGEVVLTAAPDISPWLIGISLGMACLTGVAGGIIPAYKASRIMPVDALRYE